MPEVFLVAFVLGNESTKVSKTDTVFTQADWQPSWGDWQPVVQKNYTEESKEECLGDRRKRVWDFAHTLPSWCFIFYSLSLCLSSSIIICCIFPCIFLFFFQPMLIFLDSELRIERTCKNFPHLRVAERPKESSDLFQVSLTTQRQTDFVVPPVSCPCHCSWPPVSEHWWSIIWLTYLFICHLLLLPCTVSYPSCIHPSVVPEVSWTQEHPSFLLFNVPSCQRISYPLLGLF